MTATPPPGRCEASWDNCDGEAPHRCDRPLDHRDRHECGCGQTAPQCGAEYAPERRDPTARIVRCDLVAGHDGDHEELFTEATWPQTAEHPPVTPPLGQPATPAHTWRAAYCDAARRMAELGYPKAESHLLGVVNAIDVGGYAPWADELDAAPAAPCGCRTAAEHAKVTAAFAEPPKGDWLGEEFDRADEALERLPGWAQPVVTRPGTATVPDPLSTVPPARTGADDAT